MSLVVAIGVFFINFLLIGLFRHWALHKRVLLDVPNERSSHREPTVRGAGIIFVLSALIGWVAIGVLTPAPHILRLSLGGMIIAGVSFFDDLYGLRIRVRLLAQLGGALVFLWGVAPPSFLEEIVGQFAILWIPLAAFFMVAVINIYNFMDGVDGIAALHSSIVLVSWIALTSSEAGITPAGLACVALGVPLLAFLVKNWSPARVFMGDAGSTFLGYFFAALAVMQVPGAHRSTNFVALILLMMPFLFDATMTIIVRFSSGERWYLPHKQHLFQRLHHYGYSHAAISSVYGMMTLMAGALLLLVFNSVISDPILILALVVSPYLSLYFWVYRLERFDALAVGEKVGDSPRS